MVVREKVQKCFLHSFIKTLRKKVLSLFSLSSLSLLSLSLSLSSGRHNDKPHNLRRYTQALCREGELQIGSPHPNPNTMYSNKRESPLSFVPLRLSASLLLSKTNTLNRVFLNFPSFYIWYDTKWRTTKDYQTNSDRFSVRFQQGVGGTFTTFSFSLSLSLTHFPSLSPTLSLSLSRVLISINLTQ